jgi:hypothetical protein
LCERKQFAPARGIRCKDEPGHAKILTQAIFVFRHRWQCL